MKTALAQLIDYIESSCTKGGYITVEPNEILDKAEELIAIEQKQIETAVEEGIKYGKNSLMNFDSPASRYYNHTYKTLHNVQAQKGEVQVLENIDMDECDPVEDWEIAYQQVFPCSHVLDKETQSHFKDGFMEGYKFKKTE